MSVDEIVFGTRLGMKSKLKNVGKQQAIRVQWTNANDQTEPEGPIGRLEINSLETKYIEQDELGLYRSRLNYDSDAAVTALPIAIAGDLPLEKCGEFRVVSGAIIPNLGKIKMKSIDESGIERAQFGETSRKSPNSC